MPIHEDSPIGCSIIYQNQCFYCPNDPIWDAQWGVVIKNSELIRSECCYISYNGTKRMADTCTPARSMEVKDKKDRKKCDLVQKAPGFLK